MAIDAPGLYLVGVGVRVRKGVQVKVRGRIGVRVRARVRVNVRVEVSVLLEPEAELHMVAKQNRAWVLVEVEQQGAVAAALQPARICGRPGKG